MSRPLGFNDTYAIGMREKVAARLGVASLSDLRRHPDLKFGFSNEFMDAVRRLAGRPRPAMACPSATSAVSTTTWPTEPLPVERSRPPTSTRPTPRSSSTTCACCAMTSASFPRTNVFGSTVPI